MWKSVNQFISPKSFYRIAGQMLPWCWLGAFILLAYGITAGLAIAPPDYQQGDAYRIMYVHVPTAILSLLIFAAMAVWSAVFLIWRIKIADICAKVSAPIGAWVTLCVLVAGSLWGKPMWGTYWIWDARLTSELILLFLYIGIAALRQAIPDQDKAAKAAAIVTLIGVVDIPIIHYSVYWWNTLHQKDSLSFFAKSAIAPEMLYPLLACIFGFVLLAVAIGLLNCQAEILQREIKTDWVKELVSQ